MNLDYQTQILDKFFGPVTMSVHFKENVSIYKKIGQPGNWKIEIDNSNFIDKNYLLNLISQLYEESKRFENFFLEIDNKYSKVFQLGKYRVVIVLPPLANTIEITIVKPIKILKITDYNLNNNILNLLQNKSKGILIAGAPGEGKTTFAQAIIQMFQDNQKIIKTIESPRDLQVAAEVTQYSLNYAPYSEIRDILLLSRPDYTIYDEIRNKQDFELFTDLRLTGIGLVGVIHATNPVDSIQRFIGVIDMGIIPQVIDTVIFISGGQIKNIYQLESKVKVPTGMDSQDLARPIIEITDFASGEILYEIYSYGEQVVVIPVKNNQCTKNKSPLTIIAQDYLQNYLEARYNFQLLVSITGSNSINIYLPESYKGQIIGKQGANIMELEKELQLSISIKTLDEIDKLIHKYIILQEFSKDKKNYYHGKLGSEYSNQIIYGKIEDKIYKLEVDNHGEFRIKNKKINSSNLQMGIIEI